MERHGAECKPVGRLSVVGIGPGTHDLIAPKALKAIEESDLVIGYRTYMLLVRSLVKGKETIKTGMTEEIDRARHAIDQAKTGRKVCLISSGDAGVYGMAGLVFEVLRQSGWKRSDPPELEVIPGITALNACASLVGAPLCHDSCMISLSDLLTPWPAIVKKIRCAAEADFVIGLYNPASGRRQRQIVEAKKIIAEFRDPETPVALVKSAYRHRQDITYSTLKEFLEFEIGMLTTVLIGSSQTYMYEGYMITPRGYANKYDIEDGTVHRGQVPGQSLNLEPPEPKKRKMRWQELVD